MLCNLCLQGTQIYDAKKGSFVDLGILDVMQIFGRAGRPQYDTFGHGTIITAQDKLSHYLSLMTRQNPIESQFINSLTDNLNAEVKLILTHYTMMGIYRAIPEKNTWGAGRRHFFFYPTTHGIQFPPTQTTHVIRKFRTPTTHRIQFS